MNDQIFISYSHKDNEWLERFQVMLKPLTKNQSFILWDDTLIKPGIKWKEDIEKNLANSTLALLLVSKDFLASDFVTDHELPVLLNAAEKKGLVIFWVPIGPSMYKATEIANYQAVHDPTKPLNTLDSKILDQEIVAICNKISEMGRRN